MLLQVILSHSFYPSSLLLMPPSRWSMLLPPSPPASTTFKEVDPPLVISWASMNCSLAWDTSPGPSLYPLWDMLLLDSFSKNSELEKQVQLKDNTVLLSVPTMDTNISH